MRNTTTGVVHVFWAFFSFPCIQKSQPQLLLVVHISLMLITKYIELGGFIKILF